MKFVPVEEGIIGTVELASTWTWGGMEWGLNLGLQIFELRN